MKRNNITKCRSLRKTQTEAEKKLWSILRNRQIEGVKFRRQFPIDKYILDFYSPELKLGIEADGGQHYEEEGRVHDERRTQMLSRLDIKILRFSNLDILQNIEGVFETIRNVIQSSPSPQSSPRGERKVRKIPSPQRGEG